MPDLAVLGQDVLARATQTQEREKGKQAEGQLAQRLSILSGLLEQLKEIREFESGWLSAGLPRLSEETSEARVAQARDRIDGMARAHADDPTALLGDGSFRLLVRSLETALRSLDATASAAWAVYSQQALPPALGGDEQLLRADPRTTSEVVDRLLSWDRHLRVLSSKVRPTTDELLDFIQVRKSREALWSSIDIEQDPEVVDFIRASGDRGAPLDLLTDKVVDWLKAAGLFETYIIKKRP